MTFKIFYSQDESKGKPTWPDGQVWRITIVENKKRCASFAFAERTWVYFVIPNGISGVRCAKEFFEVPNFRKAPLTKKNYWSLKKMGRI